MLLRLLIGAVLVLVSTLSMATRVFAHQPFFEDIDYTEANPRSIADPTVSTALYGTLSGADDVDYFTFEGRRGQEILVRVDIPQLAGLEQFAPTVALLGPGLPATPVPRKVAQPSGTGAMVIPPPEGKPSTFYEPFTQTTYWTRQVERITLPADGKYWLTIYDPAGKSGRYVLSVGEKEVPGGDPQFREKLRRFFSP